MLIQVHLIECEIDRALEALHTVPLHLHYVYGSNLHLEVAAAAATTWPEAARQIYHQMTKALIAQQDATTTEKRHACCN